MAENESIMYAADNGADVVNLSSNGYWTRTLVPECGRPGIYNLEKFGTNKNQYDELIVELEAELEMIEEALIEGDTLLVAAAGNCGIDHDDPDVFYFPGRLESDHVLVVGGSIADGPWIDTDTNQTDIGDETVHLAAPAGGHATLDEFGQTGLSGPTCPAECAGTSFSAPTVTGAAALLIANDESLREDIPALRGILLDTADQLPGLETSVQEGRRLNVANAMDSL